MGLFGLLEGGLDIYGTLRALRAYRECTESAWVSIVHCHCPLSAADAAIYVGHLSLRLRLFMSVKILTIYWITHHYSIAELQVSEIHNSIALTLTEDGSSKFCYHPLCSP